MKITLDLSDETMEKLARYHMAQCMTAVTINRNGPYSDVVKKLVSTEMNKNRLLLADSILRDVCTAFEDNEAYAKKLDEVGELIGNLLDDAGELEA